jgi:hypothetical protein
LTRVWRSLCIACAGLALACATTEPFQPSDASLLVTLATLSEFGLELPDGYAQHEKFRRERMADDSLLLEYEFQTPDGSPPFVYSSAELHPSARDACLSFSAGNLGLRLSSLEPTDRNDLFSYGEKSRFALVEHEGKPVGNVFAMCRSRTAMLVMFVGLYFDDAEGWRALIEPSLRALEAFEAANPAE